MYPTITVDEIRTAVCPGEVDLVFVEFADGSQPPLTAWDSLIRRTACVGNPYPDRRVKVVVSTLQEAGVARQRLRAILG